MMYLRRVSLLFIPGLFFTPVSSAQIETKVLIFFDNPRMEGADLARGDSSAVPFTVYPVERTIKSKSPEQQTLRALLQGPSVAEIDSGYSTNLDHLHLSSFLLKNGIATVKLTGKLFLKGTLSGPRLRLQVERTLRQFNRVQNVVLSVNGKKDFDSLK